MPGEKIITPLFRANYVHAFKAKENKKDDGTVSFDYECMCLFPKGTDLSALTALVTATATEKWGADKSKWPKPLRNPIRDQEEKEKDGKLPDGMEAGAKFISIKSKSRPGLVDANRQPIIDESEVYSGCYMKAQIHAYAYDKKGNRGVSFGLDNFQKVKDGDPLSGRQRAEDAFEAVAGASSAGGASEDPFA